MAISAISSSFGNVGLASPVQMVRNLKLIALPAIALVASLSAPKAEALGTIGCVICLSTGVGLPLCMLPCGFAIMTVGIMPLF